MSNDFAKFYGEYLQFNESPNTIYMGYYTKKKTASGQFMFNLHAGNNEIILTSEQYTSESGCDNGIRSCQANSPNDARYDRLTASNGKPYFTLKAANGEVIGRSEMYNSTSGRDNGIESCKKNGPSTDIRDRT